MTHGKKMDELGIPLPESTLADRVSSTPDSDLLSEEDARAFQDAVNRAARAEALRRSEGEIQESRREVLRYFSNLSGARSDVYVRLREDGGPRNEREEAIQSLLRQTPAAFGVLDAIVGIREDGHWMYDGEKLMYASQSHPKL